MFKQEINIGVQYYVSVSIWCKRAFWFSYVVFINVKDSIYLLSFRQNFRISERSSVRFSLGTGVNCSPYLHKADLALASISFEDKLIALGFISLLSSLRI